MRNVSRLIASLAMLWCLGVSAAQAQNAERAEALLRIVGIDAFLDSFSAELTDADNPMAGSFGDGSDAWVLAARQHFPSDEMFSDMIALFEGAFEDDELEQLFAFYESPLGLRVTGLEVASQVPEEADRVEAEGAEILAELIRDESPRLAIYEEMIDALSAIDTGLALAMNLNFAVMTGMSGAGDAPFSLGEGDILALIESQRGAMEAAIREQLYVSLAFTYAPLSDEEAQDYTDFLATDAGRGFYRRLNGSVEEIMQVRARAFGARLVELQAGQSL